MKYETPKYAHRGLDLLPAFMALLKHRTVEGCMEALASAPIGNKPTEFIEMVEGFIFITINIADPETMEFGLTGDKAKRYIKRRSEFLKALGLDEYARTTYLLDPKSLRPEFNRN